ncbi:HlyD family efflux transporter periplasmic adaptor subunit [Pseudoalteromonas neustonica]|uniref:HlyD family efflux transporter periplasmic adaptor subunit n=1 Tax=Pseudoalteromonas neustonica TaxID=1840331 RepID=A0ABY3FHS5_9GAMM|nr:efflux RND transporter periplasmic adaptor subunit [Pseudoalteromonas neustonica]TVU85396.1 HlyD family efflux transporter periplasmic adaptor subunit [Pseudoalteromonas neustonica]
MLKNQCFKACLGLLLYSLAFSSNAQSLLLSGELKASDKQIFYAPKSDNWRVQVQWMMKEGEIAQQGDVVVVFDSGSIASEIEQDEVSLEAAEEELLRITTSNQEKQIEAEFNFKRTELLLARARIDAAIPHANLSTYDYQKNQLELEKALINKQKSSEELSQVKTENTVARNKQLLTIEQLKTDLAYNKTQLASMSIKAQRTGPVLYANHPWNGEKAFVGMTAQPGWKIVEIPAMSELYIEAWVHEIDYQHLQLGQQAKLLFDAYLQQPLNATLSEISTQPEERLQWGKDAYFRTRFNFNAQNLKLLPGMSAKLTIGEDSDES